MHGYLEKYTNCCGGWKFRWVFIHKNEKKLSYYTSAKNGIRKLPKRVISLENATFYIHEKNPDEFTVKCGRTRLRFKARTEGLRMLWIKSLVYTKNKEFTSEVSQKMSLEEYTKILLEGEKKTKSCGSREITAKTGNERIQVKFLRKKKNIKEKSLSDKSTSSLSSSYKTTSAESDKTDVYDTMYDQMENPHLMPRVVTSQELSGKSKPKPKEIPIWLLEKRSLLEFYADFFSHADLLVEVAKCKTAQQRMVAVAKLYLSGFSTGGRTGPYRKPLNPVLGEFFRSWWNVPEDDQGKLVEGPCPWCYENQMTYIAEQVSHKPPVTAFYCEYPAGKLTVSAHVHPGLHRKGLRAVLVTKGSGKLSLLENKEDYHFRFPDVIVTNPLKRVPCMEIVDSVQIYCPQSKYKTIINFVKKPFFRGTTDVVTGKVIQTGKVAPVLTIQGNWRGVINGTWKNGKTEELLNLKKPPAIKKNVKPIGLQDKYESRNVWKDVSLCLVTDNFGKAQEYKTKIQDEQREAAETREKSGEEWKQRFFTKSNNVWNYKNNLIRRKIK